MHQIAIQLPQSLHLLTPELASFVSSDAFKKTMAVVEKDADTKAFLAIEALKGIALDPLTGKKPEAFYFQSGDRLCFNLKFDRWVNFIGWFELPENSGRAKQVVEAIRSNLESRMFKAASMHRRLDKRRANMYEQVTQRARKAYAEVVQKCSRQEAPEEVRRKADAAYDSVFDRRWEDINARVRKIAKESSPGFRGGYSEAVANFLYWHLPMKA